MPDILEGDPNSTADPSVSAPEPAPAPEIEFEELTVDGQTYRVQKGLREALKPKPLPPPAAEPAKAPAEPEVDLTALWFTNPARAAEIVEERAYRRARADYEMVEAGKRFWKEFDNKHPDLRRARKVAEKVVLTEPKYRTMRDDEALTVLADDVRTLLRESTADPEPAPPPIVEGGTSTPRSPAPKAAAAEKKVEPASLTDVVRERRRRRMAAMSQRQSA